MPMLGLALVKTLNRMLQVLAGRQQVYGAFRRQVRIEALRVIKMRRATDKPEDERPTEGYIPWCSKTGTCLRIPV